MSIRRPSESPTTREQPATRDLPVYTEADSSAPRSIAGYELRCSLHAPLPIDTVYRVFEEPRNLGRITPSWLRFDFRSPGAIEMRPGVRIDYTIHWLGLPMRWTSAITTYDPPHRFVDEQVRGPYAYWSHRHDFFSDRNGTVIADRVRYSLPFGPLGRLAHAVMVKRQLLAIFRFRQNAVNELMSVRCATLEAPYIHSLGRR